MKIFADTSENHFEFEWTDSNGESCLSVDGKKLDLVFNEKSENRYILKKGAGTYNIAIDKNEQGYTVFVNGTPFQVAVIDEHTKKVQQVIRARGLSQTEKIVKAQIPGFIADVLAVEGTEVEEGQPLLILEAMKMENVIKAPFDGMVIQVLIKSGDTVRQDQELIKIKSS